MTRCEVTIVHIDDEPSMLSALRRSLTRSWPASDGILRLHSCVSPSVALDTLLVDPVDVVISDYRMPEMDGVELLRRVRERQPHAGRVLLSGTAERSFLRSAVNHAAVARVLRKPWRDDDLLEAVRHCVQLRRLQMENAQLSDQVSAQRRQLSQQEGSLRHYRELHSAGAALSFPADQPDPELS